MSDQTKSLTVIALICALLGALAFTGAVQLVGLARGEPTIDAGPEPAVVVDAGTTPAGAPVEPPATIKDPVQDPGGFARDVQSAFKAGQWFMLAVVGLFGLSRVLLWAAAKWSVDWLKRWAPVLVTASSLLAAVGASLMAGGTVDWQTTLGALLAAIALYLRPEPKPATL